MANPQRPQLPPPIPSGPLWLGMAGLIPFVGSALLMLAHDRHTADTGLAIFAIYSAAMLSFLGGVRCGFIIAHAPDAPNMRNLFASALPALGGWLLAFIVIDQPALRGASGIFAGLFAAQYVMDRASFTEGLSPRWYPVLREVLTGGVMLTCLILIIARTSGRI